MFVDVFPSARSNVRKKTKTEEVLGNIIEDYWFCGSTPRVGGASFDHSLLVAGCCLNSRITVSMIRVHSVLIIQGNLSA